MSIISSQLMVLLNLTRSLLILCLWILPLLFFKKNYLFGCIRSSLLHIGSSLHRVEVFVWCIVCLLAAHRLSCSMACGILVPWPGTEPMSPALPGRLLTTGPPGKSLNLSLFDKGSWRLQLWWWTHLFLLEVLLVFAWRSLTLRRMHIKDLLFFGCATVWHVGS